MPELEFYFTETDEFPIVAAALDLRCGIIPDLDYSEARFEFLRSIEEYRRCRQRTNLFFLLSDEFTRYPLEMRKIDKQGKTIYYISQRSGGPTIHFLSAGLFDQAGAKFIRSGFLAYHSTYENPLTGGMEKVPLELVTTYKSLAKVARKSATRIKLKRLFWLGAQARQAVENGARLVGFEKYSSAELLK